MAYLPQQLVQDFSHQRYHFQKFWHKTRLPPMSPSQFRHPRETRKGAAFGSKPLSSRICREATPALNRRDITSFDYKYLLCTWYVYIYIHRYKWINIHMKKTTQVHVKCVFFHVHQWSFCLCHFFSNGPSNPRLMARLLANCFFHLGRWRIPMGGTAYLPPCLAHLVIL